MLLIFVETLLGPKFRRHCTAFKFVTTYKEPDYAGQPSDSLTRPTVTNNPARPTYLRRTTWLLFSTLFFFYIYMLCFYLLPDFISIRAWYQVRS